MDKKLTKEQAIAEHRKMWRWIAKETKKQQRIIGKEEYLERYFPEDYIYNGCFCCEYGRQRANSGGLMYRLFIGDRLFYDNTYESCFFVL